MLVVDETIPTAFTQQYSRSCLRPIDRTPARRHRLSVLQHSLNVARRCSSNEKRNISMSQGMSHSDLDDGSFSRLQGLVKQAGQEHLLADWQQLSTDQRAELSSDIQEFDLHYVNTSYEASKNTADGSKEPPQPVQNVTTVQGVTQEAKLAWTQTGCQLIAEGKVAVVLLAGGQGTRLGSPAPKGCFDIGLPSHKSLFHLQAERLRKIQMLAAEAVEGFASQVRKPVRWYIMTSPSTDQPTKQHFQQHGYFGLEPEQFFFFQQGQLPCLSEEGRVIMSSPSALAKAPDGNGGIYLALAKSGALAHMQRHGIEAVDCYAVDNALVKPADPLFIGHCYSHHTDCGARVVAKAYPEEKVGVFAQRGEHVEVVEYSEMDPQEAASTDPGTGELRFAWSNVCMHYFSTAFLAAMAQKLKQQGQYHLAKKKIPSKDGPVQGVKLELFIFDTFPFAEHVCLMEVPREAEFAPVKNAPGSPSDSPDTARQAIMALHQRWVEAAGGTVESSKGIEVSPLVSYGGEGLEQFCKGQTFSDTFDRTLQANEREAPSNDELRTEIAQLLSEVGVMNASMMSVMQHLNRKFKMDLTQQRPFIQEVALDYARHATK